MLNRHRDMIRTIRLNLLLQRTILRLLNLKSITYVGNPIDFPVILREDHQDRLLAVVVFVTLCKSYVRSIHVISTQ